ncbi:MAG: CBS domain-containing protein [Gammaproteobacteria bacterium]
MRINKFMSTNVETIPANATTKVAARKMHDLHVGMLPVVEDDKLVGILTDRDITCRVVATGHDAVMTQVNEVMKKDIVTCFDDEDLTEAANIMKLNRIRRLTILNHDNKITGLLSVKDIAKGSHQLASSVLVASTTLH